MESTKFVLMAWLCVVLTFATPIILYFVMPLTSPLLMTGAISLSRPDSAIRRDLLRITPVGTSKEDVLNVIEEREWALRWTRTSAGFFLNNRGQARGGPSGGERVEIGTQSARVWLGSFDVGSRHLINLGFLPVNIVRTHITVFYAFDEDSNLIDIGIWRDMDIG
ncbi:MAG: hypothetical protein FWD03_02995 [Defluviitaleaceae bacterium]|nr:hypothetical protein [Defluviitaleaceae bacterium]